MAAESDKWHRWLTEVRHGGDQAGRQRMLVTLHQIRDEVLDRADLQPGDTVLDVGTGDGLLAFGALDRVGPAGRVIFTDISADLLEHCSAAAAAAGAGRLARCEFVLASADGLAGLPDACADVVLCRSVLIYVPDKAAAFAAFRRVLRPGGRVSLCEPINVLMHGHDRYLFYGYDLRGIAPIADKLFAGMSARQSPGGADPMTDFDDRDLVRLAEQAGFAEVSLDLRVTVRRRREPAAWETFLRSSGNPHQPPLRDLLGQALSLAEIGEFTAHLRPLVESGRGERRVALAYLAAREAD